MNSKLAVEFPAVPSFSFGGTKTMDDIQASETFKLDHRQFYPLDLSRDDVHSTLADSVMVLFPLIPSPSRLKRAVA